MLTGVTYCYARAGFFKAWFVLNFTVGKDQVWVVDVSEYNLGLIFHLKNVVKIVLIILNCY